MTAEKFNSCIKKVKDGDIGAMAPVYQYFCRLLHFCAFGVLKNTSDAEDVVSELFSYIILHISKIKFIQAPRAWLLRSVRNRSIAFLKKRQKRINNSTEYIEDSIEDVKTGDLELKQLINKEVDKLKEKQKEIFKLHYIHGYKYKEISTIINCNENTIKTIVAQIKVKLASLKEYL